MTITGRSTRVRPVRVAKAVAVVDRRPDGTTYLRNPNPLGPYPVALTDRLVEWAQKAPGRTLAAQRDAHGEWQHMTYADALDRVRRVAQALLAHGGTLYIDEGKPTPDGMAITVRNLREIAPTAYYNVPRSYEMLMAYLKRDAAFRRHFFSRVKLLFYAAAGLGQRFWDELRHVAIDACGEEITDKGSLNQKAVLANRAALVDDLYADPPPPHVMVCGATVRR